MSSEQQPSFAPALVAELLANHAAGGEGALGCLAQRCLLVRSGLSAADCCPLPCSAGPVSLNANAKLLAAELLRLFVAQAWERSQLEADTAGDEEVGTAHVEKILPQLLLDF